MWTICIRYTHASVCVCMANLFFNHLMPGVPWDIAIRNDSNTGARSCHIIQAMGARFYPTISMDRTPMITTSSMDANANSPPSMHSPTGARQLYVGALGSQTDHHVYVRPTQIAQRTGGRHVRHKASEELSHRNQRSQTLRQWPPTSHLQSREQHPRETRWTDAK